MTTDSTALLDRYAHAVLGVFGRPALVLDRGEGCWVWDVDGKRYLDLLGGIAVNALGHNHPAVVSAVSKQAGEALHVSNFFTTRAQIELAERLLRLAQAPEGSAVFFTNSGTESIEAAIKLARRTGRPGLVALEGSFHGRSTGALALTHKAAYREPFAPLLPGVAFVPPGDIDALRAAVDESTGAVVLEPIQGEAGVRPLDTAYLEAAREITRAAGALLVVDEIQTGIGRTGKLFAFEHSCVRPDILTLAKGIGGGYPISAMLTTAALDIFEPGDQGGSYCAQPLGMAVGEAVVTEVVNGGWVENARVMGEYLQELLGALGKELGKAPNGKPYVSNVRGKGLLVAFDLPDNTGASVVQYAMAKGLLLNSPQPAAIRLMPPLIVDRNDMDAMIKTLRHVLVKCHQPAEAAH